MIKGQIHPNYCDPKNDELLQFTDQLLNIFEGAARKHEQRQDIQSGLDDILSAAPGNLKLAKGLAKLCFDRCEFEVFAEISPATIREAVFAESTKQRIEQQFDREQVIKAVAESLGITELQLEAGIYADLKSENRLQSFKSITPAKLIERYNLALAQAVLYKATELKIKVEEPDPAHYRRLFRSLKFHRLLHRVKGSMTEGFEVVIDGPMSLFTKSQQYGLRMARFLPHLLRCQNWSLEARIRWGKTGKTTRGFQVDPSTNLTSHLPDIGVYVPEDLADLANDWDPKLDWQVTTDTEVTTLGDRSVLVPDLAFVHKPSGQKVLFEAFGYWNKRSAEKRLKLLKKYAPNNLMIAVSRDLCVDQEAADSIELEELPGIVYRYRITPVKKSIVKHLDQLLEKINSKKKPKRKKKTTKKSAAKTGQSKKKSSKQSE